MELSGPRRLLEPLIRRLMHFYWRFARGLTLGVRGLVVDGEGRVFLVKHSYVVGWHLPGGGVEVGETLIDALRRELMEEGNIEITGAAALHGMFYNPQGSRRDHVAVFVIRNFRQIATPQPNHEIIAHGFFHSNALPPDTTRGTRARIAEILHGGAAPQRW